MLAFSARWDKEPPAETKETILRMVQKMIEIDDPERLSIGPVKDENYGKRSERFGVYLDGKHLIDMARHPDTNEYFKGPGALTYFRKGEDVSEVLLRETVRGRVGDLLKLGLPLKE